MNTHALESQFLTVAEVAARLEVTCETVLGWLNGGELIGVNVARRVGTKPRWRIASAALEIFLTARQTAPSLVPPRRGKRLGEITEYF